jgi:ubiquinone/menaquinone biosynthesis C-methylase UbiE
MKPMRVYFDLAYNPVYDFTIANRYLYQTLQTSCIDKFASFNDGDRVLCAGVGTGNEISRILMKNGKVNIVGVDYSNSALHKACKKVEKMGVRIEVSNMDVRDLKFACNCFDKVLCMHVMDFIPQSEIATSEIIRVLKDSGEFVITYPSETENSKLGVTLLKDSLSQNIRPGNLVKGSLTLLAQLLMSSLYMPLLLRSSKRKYSYDELRLIFAKLVTCEPEIEPFPLYQDFIVYGRK